MTNELAQAPAEARIVDYGIADAAIAKLREELTGLTIATPKDYELVKEGIATTRRLRGEIEEKRKELKASALEWGRMVDAESDRLKGLLLEIEEPLKAERKRVDDEKEAAKRRKEEEARAKVEAELRAKREAEELRLKEEREKLAAERAALEAIRAEQEARDKAERERIAAEEARQRAEREKLEAERRALEEQRLAAERAEAERLAKIQAEVDAKARAEREAAEAESRRVEQERLEAERLARIEAARPDMEKVQAFGIKIRSMELPAVTHPAAGAVVNLIREELNAIAELCEAFAVK